MNVQWSLLDHSATGNDPTMNGNVLYSLFVTHKKTVRRFLNVEFFL